jgi:DNA-binding NtrC family response regulator
MAQERSTMLTDINVLVVEDEAMIALDLSMTFEDVGAEVVGPCLTVESALDRALEADVAVLDVDLQGRPVFPVADSLARSGTPFVFHTGRADLVALRDRYGPDVVIVEKPARTDQLVRGVVSALGSQAPSRARRCS